MKHFSYTLGVAEPCTQPWAEMRGSQSERRCEACDRVVYNLEMFSARQIEALLVETDGHLCGRIRTLPDGSIALGSAGSSRGGIAFVALSSLTGIATHSIAQTPSAAITDAAGRQAEPKSFPSGIVTDQTGALVVGAHVTLSQGGVEVASSITNAVGEYMSTVPPGLYTLAVKAEGFVHYVLPLKLEAGHVAMESISLKPGLTENVQVTAEIMDSTTTVGVMVSSINYGPWYKRVGIRLRHPVAYTRYALRHR